MKDINYNLLASAYAIQGATWICFLLTEPNFEKWMKECLLTVNVEPDGEGDGVRGVCVHLALVPTAVAGLHAVYLQNPRIRVGFVDDLEAAVCCVCVFVHGQYVQVFIANPGNLLGGGWCCCAEGGLALVKLNKIFFNKLKIISIFF